MTALLVVEDDPRVASFLCRGLEAEGYRVVHVTEGEAALDAADDASFAAILLDVMLAGALDGRAVCQALRRRRDTTPILMLTALDTVQDRIEGLRMGADDYLGKPFSFDELLLRVAALIRRVWGVSEDPMTNVVDVYVGRLRRKLGLEGPAGPVITTVRGRGYRIEFLAEEAAAPAQPPGNPPR